MTAYIVYALTRPVSSAYTVKTISQENIEKQQENFNRLLAKLEPVNKTEIEKILSQREIVKPDPELTPDIINRLQTKIKNQKP